MKTELSARLLAAATLGLAGSLGAQQMGTVVGRVVDSSTNLPRPNAIAAILATGQSAVANEDGRFVISGVAAGPQMVRLRSFGYSTVARGIVVRAGDTTRVEILMHPSPLLLGAVRVDAAAADRESFVTTPNVGRTTLTARAMEAVPRLGEIDLARVVTLSPGVQARNDFSTGFNVRGGESDQNLILIDDYPIYNPFHLGGLFSTFIGSTVRDVELLNGAFPARFGGRLSSVLDVRSAEEPRPGVHGTAEVSVLASTVTLGGAFANGNGSWTVAGRRTYADQVTRLATNDPIPYHFRDEQAHLYYQLPGDARLSMTVYDGRDVLDGSFAQEADTAARSAEGGSFNFSWGNLVGGATLSKTLSGGRLPLLGWRLGDSAIAEQRVSRSRFSTSLDLGSGSKSFQNSLSDSRVGGELTAFTRHDDRTVGYEFATYDIAYTTSSTAGIIDAAATHERPTVAAAYVSDLWRMTPSFLLSSGGRFEAVTGSGWTGFSPRFSAKYLLSDRSAITAAVGRFTQWTHSLSFEDDPIKLFDYWRASDSRTPVSSAWEYVLGHERWLGATHVVRIEAFYKRYDHLLEPNFEDDPRINGDEFIDETGVSYGADLLIKAYESGSFSGWISYTYAMNSRQHDSVEYTPAQDQRNDVNLVGSWRFAKYIVGLRVGYGSGMPYTEAVGDIPRRTYDPIRNTWGTGGVPATFEDIGGVRNGARLPATQRVDLHVERRFTAGSTSISPYVSVVNATNAKNVLFYLYDFSTAPGTRRTITQFPILPSAGVSVVF